MVQQQRPRAVASLAWDSVLDHSYSFAAHLGFFVRRKHPTHSATGAPVLLIPGVYEPWTFLRPAGERLAREGFAVHYLPELGHNLLDIPATARLAYDYLVGHDLRGVSIVAHSKGGLVGKQMLVMDAAAGRIARLVAINSPFTGTRYANLTPDPALREFRPTSGVIASLSAKAEVNSKITSIFAQRHPRLYGDCHLAGATNISMPGYGHFLPLSDPAVIDAVIVAVRGAVSSAAENR